MGDGPLNDTLLIEVDGQRLYEGRPFPIALAPDAAAKANGLQLSGWVRANRAGLLHLVASHGAVLLRGWDGSGGGDPALASSEPPSANDFSDAVHALNLTDFEAACSAAPRTAVAPAVFTANEAPPNELIPMHHEMAQCPTQPAFVIFFCETPPAAGGATPIVPSAHIARYLRARHPNAASALAERGVRYVRTMPVKDDPSSPIGRSWRSTFQVETEGECEAAMREMEMSWSWEESGNLKTTTKKMPALVRRDGVETFFNAIVAALEGWVDERNDASKSIIFGDGSALDDQTRRALSEVGPLMRSSQAALAWAAGDVLILDNSKVRRQRRVALEPQVSPSPAPRAGRSSCAQPRLLAVVSLAGAALACLLHAAAPHPRLALGPARRPPQG